MPTSSSAIWTAQCSIFSTSIATSYPAVTTRGMKEEEMMDIADFIHRVLEARENPAQITKIRDEVHAFSRKFPLPF